LGPKKTEQKGRGKKLTPHAKMGPIKKVGQEEEATGKNPVRRKEAPSQKKKPLGGKHEKQKWKKGGALKELKIRKRCPQDQAWFWGDRGGMPGDRGRTTPEKRGTEKGGERTLNSWAVLRRRKVFTPISNDPKNQGGEAALS